MLVVAALTFCFYYKPQDTECDPITEDLAWCGAGIVMPRRQICMPVTTDVARFRLQATQSSSLQRYFYNDAWVERGSTHTECAEASSMKSGITGGFHHLISLEYEVRGTATFNPLNGELYYSECAAPLFVNVSLSPLAGATTNGSQREACDTWLFATTLRLMDWREEEVSTPTNDDRTLVYHSALKGTTVRCNLTVRSQSD
jgi:hypothetical protein